MDMKYFEYIFGSDKYYMPLNFIEDNFDLHVPSEWKIHEGKHWINVFPKNNYLTQQQGWKIHISTDISEAQDVLKDVSKLMYHEGIPFKFVKNKGLLIEKNSKNAYREASGKFITIYPNEIDLKATLIFLEKLLKKYKKGAYILSDRRWKNSNIYYRYGAFVSMQMSDGRFAIKDPEGNLIEDLRLPYYYTPEWVEKPDFLLENEIEEYSYSKLEEYTIEQALHFSNSGGVYVATDKNNNKFLLKEARPNAGLDGTLSDAIYRLDREFTVLTQLEDVHFTPKVYDYFQAWEHKFLVQEFVEGEAISSWIARNYPFSENENIDRYITNLEILARKCCQALEEIHKHGLTHGDVQPRNIMVSEYEDTLDIKFIDFETYGILGERGKKILGTPGFYNKIDDLNEHKDWMGLLRIFKLALLPISSLEMLAQGVYNKQKKWIKTNLGNRAVDVLNLIEDFCKNKPFNVLEEISRPFTVSDQVFQYNELYDITLQSLKKNINHSRENIIYGDVKQYSNNMGKHSVAYGNLGVLLTLYRLNEIDHIEKEFINKYNILSSEIDDYGLFTGLAGVANSLIEMGNINSVVLSDYVLNAKEQILKNKNISLESGLAGIGLSMLDCYISNKNEDYLNFAKEIYIKLKNIYVANPEDIIIYSDSVTSDGLMYGWTGVIWFSYSLYNITTDKEYIEFAKEIFNYEFSKTKEKRGMLQLKTKDEKLMPYLSIGSSGILLTAILIKKHIDSSVLEKIIDGVIKTISGKPCVCAGLFEGFLGLIYTAKFIDKYTNSSIENKLFSDLHQYLLIENQKDLALPGNYSLRVSYDLASGLTGLLNYIGSNKYDGFMWLPIKNQNILFNINTKNKF